MVLKFSLFILILQFVFSAAEARDPVAVKKRLLRYAKERNIYIPKEGELDPRVAERRKDDYSVVPYLQRKTPKRVAQRLARYRQLNSYGKTQTLVQQASATDSEAQKKPYVYTERLKMATQKTVQADRGFHLSPHVGTHLSWFDISDIDGDVEETGADAGFSFGLKADIAMDRFVIETGVIVQQSNFNVKLNRLNNTNGDIEWLQSLNHIYIPAIVRYNIFNWANGRFYGLGGMKFGFLLSAEADVSQATTKKSENSNVVDKSGDNTEFFSAMDFGVLAGVGGSTPVSDSLSAFLETNFYYGFSDASAVNGASLNAASVNVLFGLRTSFNL